MVDGVGEEVRVDEDLVGRLESGVVLEEHATRRLWAEEKVSDAQVHAQREAL